ncbi:MAG: feruloyl-CoA synthase [Henriciella sp.]
MSTTHLPFRNVPYLPQKLQTSRLENGDILLSNGQPLKSFPTHLLAPILYWAEHASDRVWLAQRDPVDPLQPGWQTLTYGQALVRLRALVQGFLDHGGAPNAPVMILSRNSIDHALIMYAAMWAGRPVVPVTPAYALISQDFSRLNYIDKLTEPAIVYVEDGVQYQRGLDAMALDQRLVIYSRNAPENCNAKSINDLARPATSDVDAALARVQPDDLAKLMLTSGSTGEPKAVINTHRMVSANAKMIRSVWDEDILAAQSGGHQVMCNFLPWSHTYGAHAILHNMTDWGGTLYIDWGAPTPERLPQMLRNLKEVSTTQHTTVPAAWAALATALEQDRALAEVFFKRLIVMAYGGAAMGQDIYERIQAVAVNVTGERISLSAGYGATETSPTASNVHWPNDTMGLIGCPLPGNEFKLVPAAEKLELRVRGVNVTPGYYRDPERTAAAFDEDGYYRLGDAVRFVDPDMPEKGLAFDGRTAEEFKLANGSWVSAGQVRVKAVAAIGGVLSDVVVCGLNQDNICLLGFLDETYCARLTGEALTPEQLVGHEQVIASVRQGLEAYNHSHPNAASRIARIVLQVTPPQADSGEITEKGYINQSRVLSLRADEVHRLYSADPDTDIIII